MVNTEQMPADMARLDGQLLMHVLKHVDQKQRLGVCALVSTAWRTPAALATSQVTLHLPDCHGHGGLNQPKCSALTRWLQQYGHPAKVESITVESEDSYFHDAQLMLPLLQLPSLRKLSVKALKVEAVRSLEPAALAPQDPMERFRMPVLPAELSALTHLDLCRCYMGLAALPTFTDLQHLAINNHNMPVDFHISSNVQAMRDALPKLQQLTYLHLSMLFSRDSVLEQLRQLSALRELRLSSADCTTASFALDALPKSLTSFNFEGVVGTFTRTFSPSTMPALTQLTALQELRVACIATFDVALVDSLTALRHLHVYNCSLGPTVGLTALSSLTQLQHLYLPDPSHGAPAASAAAEIAALTASSQLTSLGIDNDLVTQQQYIHLFPEGRKLPHLQMLQAPLELLGDLPTVIRMVECCPGLCEIRMRAAYGRQPAPAFVTAHYEPWGSDRHSWQPLSELSALTSLHLGLSSDVLGQEEWSCLGLLTSLHKLVLQQLKWEFLPGVTALLACRQLTKLEVMVGREHLVLTSKAPAGSPPDVWCQLPVAVLQLAVQRLSGPVPDYDLEDLWDDLRGDGPGPDPLIYIEGEQRTALLQSVKEAAEAALMLLKEARQQQQQQQQGGPVCGTLGVMAAELAALLQQ